MALAQKKIESHKIARRDEIRERRVIEQQVNHQLTEYNKKLEMLKRAKRVYNHPVEERTIIEIESLIKEIKLARDEHRCDDTSISLNAQMLIELEKEEKSIYLKLADQFELEKSKTEAELSAIHN